VTPRRLAAGAVFALFALSWAWYLWLAPPVTLPPWLVAAGHASMMLPSVLLLFARRPSALFWGAVGALFAFCHGVMEAWSAPAARLPAWIEIALALVIIFGASWAGMRGRFAKKRSSPPGAL
jgi:uncharacterized membrane protein